MEFIKKFNLISGIIFLAGLLSVGVIFYSVQMSKAKEESIREADIILENAVAAWEYTATEVVPLFTENICKTKDTFYPQSVPAYAANRIFRLLNRKGHHYTYREVASNPRNLNDLPSAWEIEIIRHYIRHTDAKRMVYTRRRDGEELLYVTYPIKITDEVCLECHTDAETAPKSLVEKYGPVNGMNWKFGEVVGARLASISMSEARRKAIDSLFTMLTSLVSIFIIIMVVINFMLSRWLVIPLLKIKRIAEDISLGKNRGRSGPMCQTGKSGDYPARSAGLMSA